VKVNELAAWVGGAWEGEGGREIGGVATLEDAGPGDVAFASRGRAAKQAEDSDAGCLLVPEDWANATERTIVRVRDPRGAGDRSQVGQAGSKPCGGINARAQTGRRS